MAMSGGQSSILRAVGASRRQDRAHTHAVSRFAILVAALFSAVDLPAQTSLPVYTDHLVNGFQDWGWAAHNYANPSPVHSGASSIAVTVNAWEGLEVYHPDCDSARYGSLSFWINGGANGGQKLQVIGLLHVGTTDNAPQSSYSLGALQTNTWQFFNVPLSALGVANRSNFTGFLIQDRIGAAQPTFYVDDIQLPAAPAPAVTHLSINATQSVRSVDARWFGINTAVWDWYFDTPQTVSLLKEMGARVLRFPGGSMSDTFHWRSNYAVGSTWQGWPTWFTNFAHVATNVGAQAIITANYGSGTPAEAADWVRFSNVTNHYGFKYWEVGNENYGTWEFDINTNAPYHANDAWTYGTRAKDYIQQMKAADPSIKIGVVVTPGDSSSSNAFASLHPAVNPRTGQTNYGWTPILLTTLRNLGITPDFAVHHVYPEWTGQESDPFLLQSTVSWAQDAADLRQQLNDYLGPDGANVELVCTENNSNAGTQGKQSVSLVNALYYADSLANLMQTEFNGFVWWDLRNGTNYDGNMDPVLYGWRMYGDIGIINNLSECYPHFYAAKIMQYFAQPGDTIIGASSDYPLLAPYAARRASGAVSVLVLNKDTTATFNGQIALNGLVPDSAATVRSFGIPQDEAARTNAVVSARDIATNSYTVASPTFSYNFPPLSMTLLTLAPAAPRLAIVPPDSAGQIVLQLQGQSNVRYILQNSSDLLSWAPFSTNTLTSSTFSLTNPLPTGSALQFYRALWQP